MTEVVPADRTPFTRAPAPLTYPFGKVIEWHPDGREKRRAFFYADSSNDYTRDDGPAWIEYHENGAVAVEGYYRDGELHREDGPAVIRYEADGAVKAEEWWKDGETRTNDFFYRGYYPRGGVQKETWQSRYRIRHRLDGPALIEYRPDGSVAREEYSRENRLHRIDGPAQIVYQDDGGARAKLYLDDRSYGSVRAFFVALGKWERKRLLNELTQIGKRRPPYNLWTDGEDLGPDPLDDLTADELCAVVIAEHFPHLTIDGVSPTVIAACLRGGVTSDDGIREVHRGAPVDWVRSFESGTDEQG